MKKNYIKPQTKTLLIESQPLLDAASQAFGAKGDASAKTQVLSRQSNGWDDEE